MAKKRSYFFDPAAGDRFSDGNTPGSATFKELLSSVLFLAEEGDLLLPEGGAPGQVLRRKGGDDLGHGAAEWVSLPDYVLHTSPRLLPAFNAPEHLLKVATVVLSDGVPRVEWKGIPLPDMAHYLTVEQAQALYLRKDACVGSGRVPTLDAYGKLPASMLSLANPRNYCGVWDPGDPQTVVLEVRQVVVSHYPLETDFQTWARYPDGREQRLRMGDFFEVRGGGAVFGQVFNPADTVVSDGRRFVKGVSLFQYGTTKTVNYVHPTDGNVDVDRLRGLDGSELYKDTIEAHIADDDRHLTQDEQFIVGRKVFLEGVSADRIGASTEDMYVYMEDGVALPLTPAVNMTGTTEVYILEANPEEEAVWADDAAEGKSFIPTSASVYGLVRNRTFHRGRQVVLHDKAGIKGYDDKAPLLEVVQDRAFRDDVTTPDGLETMLVRVANVGGNTYLSFRVADGYSADAIAAIHGVLTRMQYSHEPSEGLPPMKRMLVLDTARSPEHLWPTQLRGRALYVGANVTMGPGNTDCTFEVRAYDPFTASFSRIPYHDDGRCDLYLAVEAEYLSARLRGHAEVVGNLHVQGGMLSASGVQSDRITAGAISCRQVEAGRRFVEHRADAVSELSAPVLSPYCVNALRSVVPGALFRMPQLGADSLLGMELEVLNLSKVDVVLKPYERLRDEFHALGAGFGTKDAMTLRPGASARLMLVEKDMEWVWISL